MKKLTIILLFLLPIAAMAQAGFKVTMKLKNLGTHKVKAIYQRNGKMAFDTIAPLSSGEVVWKGSFDEPQLVRIDVIDSSLNLVIGKAVATPPSLMFLLSNSNIEIKGDAREVYTAAVISKDPEVNYYEKFRKADLPNTRQIWNLQKEQNQRMKVQDTSGTAANRAATSALRKESIALKSKFVDENPKALASFLILQSMSLQLTVQEMESKYNNLDDKYKNTIAAKNIVDKIESNKRTAIGKPVIPFAQTGYTGSMVDVSALKGKVVIIDFWGSWCVPCRRSHPELKAIYEKYQPQGLEIVGVSNESVSGKKPKEDQDKAWRKAIQEDDIKWLHILNDPDIQDLSKEFDIAGYPTKFLIDRDGKFALKLLGNSPQEHEKLIKKLEELLGKQ
jgi:thiol-disulfide isomerase/thioredoxin